MLANAGFENAYGEREVEDDLEDEFGQEVGWDSDSDDGSVANPPPRAATGASAVSVAFAGHGAAPVGGAARRRDGVRRGGGLDPGTGIGTGTGTGIGTRGYERVPVESPCPRRS